MRPEVAEIVKRQQAKFRERFGREMGPADRIFFDLQPSEGDVDAAVMAAMRDAGIRPELIYAYSKTGRIVTRENQHLIPAAALQAWHDAIEEYFATVDKQGKQPQ